MLNELNDGLKLLRENTFRLSDLKTFYDIKQVIVFENMPWTGACTRILDGIEDSRSKLIGRIVRENNLGYFQVNDMKKSSRTLPRWFSPDLATRARPSSTMDEREP